MYSKEFKDRLENKAHEIGYYSACEDFIIPEEEGGGTVIGQVYKEAKSYLSRKVPALYLIGSLLGASVCHSMGCRVMLPIFFILIFSFILVFNITFIRFDFAPIYIVVNIIVAMGFISIFAGEYYTYHEYGSSNFFPVIIGCKSLESGETDMFIADRNTYIY